MKVRVTLTAALAALTLSACGSSNDAGTGGGATNPATPTSSKASKADLVAWADKVCGVTIDSIAPMQTEPTLDQKNLNTLKNQFVDYLTKASESLGKGVTDLEALKAGPSKDSEKYVQTHAEALTKIKTTLDESITTIKASDPKNPTQFGNDLRLVGTKISGAGTLAGLSGGILVEKDLADAEKEAANCQKANKK